DLGAANLAGADFLNADLRESNLEVVDLEGANLTDANLKHTYLLYANFQGAKLARVKWDGASHLNWEQIKKVGEEKDRDWKGAEEAYRHLKNYFHQEGKYDDESKAYYREKLMAKKRAFAEGKKWRGRVLALYQALTGFGNKPLWTVGWAAAVIAFFGFLYWGGGTAGLFQFAFKPEMLPHLNFFSYIYLSVVTFATLGFGDITPLNWQAQIPVIIEVIMGYVFLGLIITIIARRFGR
ncbi:MAG: pentapeptide repeat-containing protein, partial [candidate division WOR-3 bacterium]|nr:pentapeptide repeat-containing protein [candidate division WOR-3 bacterium]